jgi:putative RNA 2'-phosphotransferase
MPLSTTVRIRISKFLSLVLRHQPETIGLVLDPEGWANVEELLQKTGAQGVPLTHELLREVVEMNDKQRFRFSEDGRSIRANQGHSVDVDLKLDRKEPPAMLFHGTADRFLASIRERGLTSGTRQHVHLSKDRDTAMKVGKRHGRPVVLEVRSEAMHHAGFLFFLSDNGVWLTESVPVVFLSFPPGETPQ